MGLLHDEAELVPKNSHETRYASAKQMKKWENAKIKRVKVASNGH